MNHDQPPAGPSPFKSRDWVLNHATEQELLEHLDCLLVVHHAQQEELLALVKAVVEEQHVLREEMEQVTTEACLGEDAPSRTSWLALGVAGLVGYLIGRRRD